MSQPELESRCLLCDAVFAEPPQPGRSVSRCKECARQIYSEAEPSNSTALPQLPLNSDIVPPQSKPELFDLEATAEEVPVVPLVKPKAPQEEDLPEAVPVVPVAAPQMKLPDWATRKPTLTGNPPVPTVPRKEPIVLPTLPDAVRPQPQYGKAFLAVGLLTALGLIAVVVLGFTIIQGLKLKKKMSTDEVTTKQR